ncbi:MAG: hypothetical protein COX34_01545 [Candidatus Nealsonbacteria bacterium CG23_combo_of_CG06-09_8_20_14_all_36_12]|uniref:Alpha/beta hydrolase n=1 Tax=Candidatus Nealsonbacteria bacterium CG23_combo_of_CG06-09_8_20_14_all_36_12 TaxID=1974718 RepID=A0A2G9Z0A6_9BACT|nr:MAG: hypothetical protein COX34_01545 [Candidatus Nealsonbacteria bacterium CG23_combo_of_CG06-09_8_20_14_all_36_12]
MDFIQSNQIIKNLKSEVVIFFAPGGWGHVPQEKEIYAKSLLKGIQNTLQNWQYKVVAIHYSRAKGGFLGKIKCLKETLFCFPAESKKLAEAIEIMQSRFQDIKIVLVGYSFGAAFIDEVMKKIKDKKEIYGIEAGTPFFWKTLKAENILYLDNNGRDALANRNFKKLTVITILGFLKLIFLFRLVRLKISESFHFKEHEYFWENPEVKSKVEDFLKSNFLKFNEN